MAIRATLLALVLACQSAPAAAPGSPIPPAAPPEPTQPDATKLPKGTGTQESTAGKLVGKDTGLENEPSGSCMDRELEKRNLDKYGNAQGTMYPGGTPLFDEASGKRADRMQYVYAHHPEIAAACGAADAGSH
jgi:hypothetical protein